MSPLKIGICFHYFVSPGDYEGESVGSPIWRETINELINDGLLESSNGDEDQTYRPTDKLYAYCEALTRMPLPVREWKTIV